METYREYRNPLYRLMDRQLDRRIARRMEEYVRRYATQPDGSLDERLAERIRYEVQRRGHMSKELDVFEPIRWSIVSFLPSFLGGIGIRLLLGDKDVEKLAWSGFATGALGTGISLLRPYARFDAALYGGAQTALGMYEGAVDTGPDAVPADSDTRSETFWRARQQATRSATFLAR